MTPAEGGFLLLASHLGEPHRRPLTPAELRNVAQWVGMAQCPAKDRELREGDLTAMGCPAGLARKILGLLEEQEMLKHYLYRGKQAGCVALTRISAGYPAAVRERLGLTAPACLWAKGDLSLLEKPAVALVGSRDLSPENEDFAREVGRQAARQGYVLISGNARGADRTAQDACLAQGGQVICVVADELQRHRPRPGMLYLSEEDFDQGFSAIRALSRNRIIHSLGQMTFVAQSGLEQGGTWNGTTRNLQDGWTPVCCFDDGSEAVNQLCQRGAEPVQLADLTDFGQLTPQINRLF